MPFCLSPTLRIGAVRRPVRAFRGEMPLCWIPRFEPSSPVLPVAARGEWTLLACSIEIAGWLRLPLAYPSSLTVVLFSASLRILSTEFLPTYLNWSIKAPKRQLQIEHTPDAIRSGVERKFRSQYLQNVKPSIRPPPCCRRRGAGASSPRSWRCSSRCPPSPCGVAIPAGRCALLSRD